MKKARNILVVTLVLLSVLSFGSVANTYAKYTSKAELSDTARVAVWDIELGGKKIWDAEAIQSLTLFDSDIVAPGMGGSVSIPEITNNSEVAATYSISFEVLNEDLEIPLEFSTDGINWTSNAAEVDLSGDLAIGQSKTLGSIQWRWAYYVSDDQDEIDTDLGIDGSETIEVKLSIIATQAAPVVTP